MPASPNRTERRQDILAGSLLLILAIAWSVTVWRTVPETYGVGPRAFPFWLGVGLAVLSALLLIKGLWGGYAAEADDGDEEHTGAPVSRSLRLAVVLGICGTISVYGFLMQKIGFVPATVLTVAGTLVFGLGERRPLVVGGMALGIAFGAWFAFGKILGAYMPPGTWITLF